MHYMTALPTIINSGRGVVGNFATQVGTPLPKLLAIHSRNAILTKIQYGKLT